jgi:glutamate synthase (NADPH/NADH) small chain
MGKDVKAFLKIKRQSCEYRGVSERVKDCNDVTIPRAHEQSLEQASRCMDCGTPFCHWACPLGSYSPEWNDLLSRGQLKRAFDLLSAANNLPEITGRLCPGLCEYACVLGINDDPVTVRENELAIIEYGFIQGLIKANPPRKRTGRKIAVIGSGPAGLSCAAQLNQTGHNVTVFEKDDKPGGLLRYGIPDFKLEKWLIDRRINLYRKEGVEFVTGKDIGVDIPAVKLLKDFDAIAICAGSRTPRDLNIEGRQLSGINFAIDYLIQANKHASGTAIADSEIIDAKSKKLVVIGGGDTGSDCVGTANRQGAANVVQIELLSKPPECRPPEYPWPKYPLILKTSSSHEEGVERLWQISTRKFIGRNGKLEKLSCIKVDIENKQGRTVINEIAGTQFEIEADMAVLALGFTGPVQAGLVRELELELDNRGNIKTGANFMASREKVFAAGDSRRGQSLVVWAIQEGRQAAQAIDEYLQG